jgi:hypothetical protein
MSVGGKAEKNTLMQAWRRGGLALIEKLRRKSKRQLGE